MKYLVFILFACLASCKAQKNDELLLGESDDNMFLVAHDAYSNITEQETSVIKDAKSLKRFYSKINKTRKPGLPVPEIDFTKNMLLLVCLGEQKEKKPLSIKRTEDNGKILITIGLSKINEASQNTSMISYPFYIYKIPNTSKTVIFQNSGR
ncbi:hypothetical protein [Flagellimonas sp.]|uniref:hypothetical protein n=1 Tax=Flagellimonas sp. TaxID=2058762 RepID=UPI003B5A9EB9